MTTSTATDRDTLWFTRCPVPTATGIAADTGLFAREFAADGVRVRSLQDAGADVPHAEHFSHNLPDLVREGGNVPALWARARGARTRLLALTWIEERQVIVTRPGSGVVEPGDLDGLRVAVPRRPIAIDFWRAMALAGFHGVATAAPGRRPALARVDITTDADAPQWTTELRALREGQVDAVYLKGAAAVAAAAAHGAEVAIDLDALPDRRARVNNGTPRPITVHEDLLQRHPDRVLRFLSTLFTAIAWAEGNPEERRRILASETGSDAAGAATAYEPNGAVDLRLDLSAERLELLAQQESFLWTNGFLENRVDLQGWADPDILHAARERAASL